MSGYLSVITSIAFVLGGIAGFIGWITLLTSLLSYGQVLWFVLALVFAEIVIPWYGIVPFIEWFLVLFVIGLPFYGLYKLIKG
jgi:hypothetical protein